MSNQKQAKTRRNPLDRAADAIYCGRYIDSRDQSKCEIIQGSINWNDKTCTIRYYTTDEKEKTIHNLRKTHEVSFGFSKSCFNKLANAIEKEIDE